MFYEQDWFFPPCRRRVGPFIQAHAGFGTDRVTPVNNTSYAVVDPTGSSALPEAEEPVLFTKHLHIMQMFCEQDRSRTMLPPAKTAIVGVHIRFERPPRNSCK